MVRDDRRIVNSKDKRLAKECLRSLKAQTSSAGPRDTQLLQQVVGMGGTERGFLYGGFTVSVGIRAALHAIGTTVYECKRILDFGCGTARVIRWFKDIRASSQLYGCDINSPAIEWCKANVDFADFVVNDPWPPLPYSQDSFDLVYGISVVTHLDEPMQLAWLTEIARVTREDGVVMLSIHGEDKAAKDLDCDEYAEFERNGFFYRFATEKPSVEGLPDFYQVAFHSKDYIRRVWREYFDLAGYVQHGCAYAQDLIVLRARKRAGTVPGYSPGDVLVNAALPIAVLETPSAGEAVLRPEFEVAGWAFYPNGQQLTVEIKVDGRSAGTCGTGLARPDVFGAFYTTPAAAQSGFRRLCSSKPLRKGWHVMWLTLKDDHMPLCATIFEYSPFRAAYKLAYRLASELIWKMRCRIRIRTRLRVLFDR